MRVQRIVANVAATDLVKADAFYNGILGLEVVMDHGWIRTYGSSEKMTVQISFASEGGSGTPVPDLSIEVDDLDLALEKVRRANLPIEYGPASEPWGVRRFYVRDPFGKLVNVLQHETLAGTPLSSRQPTSHERMTGRPWDASYHGSSPAPWDIGRPQPAFVRLASEGRFSGAVLDAGCGTGEHALLAASQGLPVLGVDVAETALAIAREKAETRGIAAEFAVADAFHLERLGRKFETVLDCGLFHTFDGDERPRYVASLASVTEPGGNLYVLCFSDERPESGPHPVRQEELRAAFSSEAGWNVAAIDSDRIQTTFHDDGAPAWLATIQRI